MSSRLVLLIYLMFNQQQKSPKDWWRSSCSWRPPMVCKRLNKFSNRHYCSYHIFEV